MVISLFYLNGVMMVIYEGHLRVSVARNSNAAVKILCRSRFRSVEERNSTLIHFWISCCAFL